MGNDRKTMKTKQKNEREGGGINSINGRQLEAWCLCMGRDVGEHQKGH
jgi:hypothetical protein